MSEESVKVRGPRDISVLEALDLHLSQYKWAGSQGHRSYVHSIMPHTFPGSRGYGGAMNKYIDTEIHTLNTSTTTLVTAEVLRALEGWFDPQDPHPLTETDLPYDRGFVVFERPYQYVDFDFDTVKAEGPEALQSIPIRAMMWGIVNDVSAGGKSVAGLCIWLYVQPDEWVSQRNQTNQIQDTYENVKKMAGSNMVWVELTGWAFDEPWEGGDWLDLEEYKDADEHHRSMLKEDGVLVVPPHLADLRLFIFNLFAFMKERVTKYPMPRAQRRRMERSKWAAAPEDGCLNVFHLRAVDQLGRVYDKDHVPGEVNWSHRWTVTGHFRKYRDEEGNIIKVTYVKGHIKGPEDKPLVLKEKVAVVER